MFNGESAADQPALGSTNTPVTPVTPAWQKGKAFWDDVDRQDTAPAAPSDEIY